METLLSFISTPSFLNFTLPAQAAESIGKAAHLLDFQEFGIRFLIDFIAILIVARGIYFARHKNRDFLFTLVVFNLINFLICFLLSGANLEIGFAFGLFAIFSIMRYRTVTLPVKEMGYLFISVAMGLLNSLATVQDDYFILVIGNAFIILLPLILDYKSKHKKTVKTKDITYERIDLIKPEKRKALLSDLRNRTGLPIHKIDITNIDLMQDIALIKAFYYEEEDPLDRSRHIGVKTKKSLIEVHRNVNVKGTK